MLKIESIIRTLGQAAILAIPALALSAAALAGEAPDLAARVAAGTLPALPQRLPANPKVVPVVERIGDYGGIWRSSMVGGNDRIWLMRINSHEPLVSWKSDWSGRLEPNIAQSYSINDDATVYAFKLRAGMRWSNGQPFTVDDIEFYFNDVIRNRALVDVGSSQIWTEDNAPAFARTGTDSFTFTFKKPFALFLQRAAGPAGAEMTMFPKHYCAQFHPKFNPAAETLAKAAGAASWPTYFRSKCTTLFTNNERYANTEIPVISAWKIERPLIGGNQLVRLGRNPYYWKVDPSGNQLPYIDTLDVGISADRETVVLKTLNGEIDFQDRHINATSNRAVFAQGRQKGGFRLVNEDMGTANTLMVSFNLTHKDERLRRVFNDKRFRIAMSYAIDRQAIIDAVYLGIGEPQQVAPPADMPFYNEQLAKQYIEYDPDKAEQILDQAGYKKARDGFRTDQSGKRITFVCATTNAYSDMIPAMELITRYWQSIGVDARMQVADRTVTIERANSNDNDCTPWPDPEGGADVVFEPRAFVPASQLAYWGVGWFQWFTNGPFKMEPPQVIRDQLALFSTIQETPDPAKQNEILKKIFAVAQQEFWTIGISTPPPSYAVVSTRMHNVADPALWGWTFLSPAATGVEQYFLAKP